MVTKEEWNREIRDLRDVIDYWDFRMDLTDDEMTFLDDIICELMDRLSKDAKWEKLQDYLDDLKEGEVKRNEKQS